MQVYTSYRYKLPLCKLYKFTSEPEIIQMCMVFSIDENYIFSHKTKINKTKLLLKLYKKQIKVTLLTSCDRINNISTDSVLCYALQENQIGNEVI